MFVESSRFRLTDSDLVAMMFIVNLCHPRLDFHLQGGGAIRRRLVEISHAEDEETAELTCYRFECLSHKYLFRIWFDVIMPKSRPGQLRRSDLKFELPRHIEAALQAGPQAVWNTRLHADLSAWECFLQWAHQQAQIELEDLQFARLKRAW